MRIAHTALTLAPGILLLAACGDYEDASAEAQADTVEIPANEPLQGVNAVPVADPNANVNVAQDEPVVEATDGAAATAAPTAGASPAASPATMPAASPAPDGE